MSFFDKLSIIGSHLPCPITEVANQAQENHEQTAENPERKRKAGKV
jgi:hypothetical protein